MSILNFRLQKSKDVENLPIHMVVYVPSTEFRTPITKIKFQKRIKETKKFLSKFGGYTKLGGEGGWVTKNGVLVTEPVAKVEAFAKSKDYLKTKQEVMAWLRNKKKEWKQDQISFEFEEDLNLIG